MSLNLLRKGLLRGALLCVLSALVLSPCRAQDRSPDEEFARLLLVSSLGQAGELPAPDEAFFEVYGTTPTLENVTQIKDGLAGNGSDVVKWFEMAVGLFPLNSPEALPVGDTPFLVTVATSPDEWHQLDFLGDLEKIFLKTMLKARVEKHDAQFSIQANNYLSLLRAETGISEGAISRKLSSDSRQGIYHALTGLGEEYRNNTAKFAKFSGTPLIRSAFSLALTELAADQWPKELCDEGLNWRFMRLCLTINENFATPKCAFPIGFHFDANDENSFEKNVKDVFLNTGDIDLLKIIAKKSDVGSVSKADLVYSFLADLSASGKGGSASGGNDANHGKSFDDICGFLMEEKPEMTADEGRNGPLRRAILETYLKKNAKPDFSNSSFLRRPVQWEAARLSKKYQKLAERDFADCRFLTFAEKSRGWLLSDPDRKFLCAVLANMAEALSPDDGRKSPVLALYSRDLIARSWEWSADVFIVSATRTASGDAELCSIRRLSEEINKIKAGAKISGKVSGETPAGAGEEWEDFLSYIRWTPQFWNPRFWESAETQIPEGTETRRIWETKEQCWTYAEDGIRKRIQPIVAVIDHEVKKLARPWAVNVPRVEQKVLSGIQKISTGEAGKLAGMLKLSPGSSAPVIADPIRKPLLSVFQYIHADSLLASSKTVKLYSPPEETPSSDSIKEQDTGKRTKELSLLTILQVPNPAVSLVDDPSQAELIRSEWEAAPSSLESRLFRETVRDLLDLAAARAYEDRARLEHMKAGFVHKVDQWNKTARIWEPSSTLDAAQKDKALEAVNRGLADLSRIAFSKELSNFPGQKHMLAGLPGFSPFITDRDLKNALNWSDFFRLDNPLQAGTIRLAAPKARDIQEYFALDDRGIAFYQSGQIIGSGVTGEIPVILRLAATSPSPLQGIPPDVDLMRLEEDAGVLGLPPVLSRYDQAFARCSIDLAQRMQALYLGQDAFGFGAEMLLSDGVADLQNTLGQLSSYMLAENELQISALSDQFNYNREQVLTQAADYTLMESAATLGMAERNLRMAELDFDHASIGVDVARVNAVAYHFLQESSRQKADAAQAAAAQALVAWGIQGYNAFRNRAQTEMLLLTLPSYMVELRRAQFEVGMLTVPMEEFQNRIVRARQDYLDSKGKDFGDFLGAIAVKLVDVVCVCYALPPLGSMVENTFQGVKAAAEGDWNIALDRLATAASESGITEGITEGLNDAAKKMGVSQFVDRITAEAGKPGSTLNRLKQLADSSGMGDYITAQSFSALRRATASVISPGFADAVVRVPKGTPPTPDDALKQVRINLSVLGGKLVRSYAASSGKAILAATFGREKIEKDKTLAALAAKKLNPNADISSMDVILMQARIAALDGVKTVIKNNIQDTGGLKSYGREVTEQVASQLEAERQKIVDNPPSEIARDLAELEREIAKNIKAPPSSFTAWFQSDPAKKLFNNARNRAESETMPKVKERLDKIQSELSGGNFDILSLVEDADVPELGTSLINAIVGKELKKTASGGSSDPETIRRELDAAMTALRDVMVEMETLAEMSLVTHMARDFVPQQRTRVVTMLAAWSQELNARLGDINDAETRQSIEHYYKNVVEPYKSTDLADFMSSEELAKFLSPPPVTLSPDVQQKVNELKNAIASGDKAVRQVLVGKNAKEMEEQIKKIAQCESPEEFSNGMAALLGLLKTPAEEAGKFLDEAVKAGFGEMWNHPDLAQASADVQKLAEQDFKRVQVEAAMETLRSGFPIKALATIHMDFGGWDTDLKHIVGETETAWWSRVVGHWNIRREQIAAAAAPSPPASVHHTERFRHEQKIRDFHNAKETVSSWMKQWMEGNNDLHLETGGSSLSNIEKLRDTARKSLLKGLFTSISDGNIITPSPADIKNDHFTATTGTPDPEIAAFVNSIEETSDFWVLFNGKTVDVGEERIDEIQKDEKWTSSDIRRAWFARGTLTTQRMIHVIKDAPDKFNNGLFGLANAALVEQWKDFAEEKIAEYKANQTQHEAVASALNSAAQQAFKEAADLQKKQAEVLRDIRKMTIDAMKLNVDAKRAALRRSELEYSAAAMQQEMAGLHLWHRLRSGLNEQNAQYDRIEERLQRLLWACLKDLDFLSRYVLGHSDNLTDFNFKNLRLQFGESLFDRRGYLRYRVLEKLSNQAAILDNAGKSLDPGNPIYASPIFLTFKISSKNWKSEWEKYTRTFHAQATPDAPPNIKYLAVSFDLSWPEEELADKGPLAYSRMTAGNRNLNTDLGDISEAPILTKDKTIDSTGGGLYLKYEPTVLCGIYTVTKNSYHYEPVYLRCAGDAYLKGKGIAGNLYRVSAPYRNGDEQYESNEFLNGRYIRLAAASSKGDIAEFIENGGSMVQLSTGQKPSVHKFRLIPPVARWEIVIPWKEVYQDDGSLRDAGWEIELKFVCVSL